MKKSSLILIATLALAAIFVCTQARGQEYSASAPIPVGSSQDQVGSGAPATKTTATDIKFFNHPAPTSAGDANFKTQRVNFPDGTTADIQDIGGATGLLKSTPDALPDESEQDSMLDNMQREPEIDDIYIVSPAHGFCPEQLKVIVSSISGIELKFQCNVLAEAVYMTGGAGTGSVSRQKNTTSRQYEVGDIRNAFSDTEFSTLFGEDPLEVGLIGSAQDTLPPYTSSSLYPATIMSPQKFRWQWLDATNKLTQLDEPFNNVYTYGLADVKEEGGKGGLVSAVYDPVNVEKKLRASLHVVFPPWEVTGHQDMRTDSKLYKLLFSYFSPLSFLSKDTTTGRMRLAGYETWQLGSIDISRIGEDLLKYFKRLFLSFNLNPIDVELIDGADHTYIAVVNQGTLGSVDRPYLNNKGTPLDLDDTTPEIESITWREILKTTSSILLDHGSPGESYFPYDVASYVVFHRKTNPWINDPSNTLSDNPNEFLDPFLARGARGIPGFALIGPGAFDSAVVSDTIGGAVEKSLLVASGEKAKDGKFYVTKINPEKAETLYFMTAPSDLLAVGVIGEPYEIGAPSGFAPYSIASGNVGGDCGAFAVTYRGENAVWDAAVHDSVTATNWYDNHETDGVRFKNSASADAKEIFSQCVYIYVGNLDGGKCKYNASPDDKICMEKSDTDPKWQIAAATFADLNRDGKDDLIIGNLNPMLIAGTDPKKYTGHIGILYNTGIDTDLFAAMPNEYKRVGFNATESAPPPEDTGEYLVDVWGDGDGLVGPGKIDVDVNGNISSVNGFPIMLPLFGCPEFSTNQDDTHAESWIEMFWSLAYNRRNPGVSWAHNNILPMRCVPLSDSGIPCVPSDDPAMPSNCGCGGACAPSHTDMCCVGCDTEDERTRFPVFCGELEACCPGGQQCGTTGCVPSSALDRPKNELFADSRGGDSGSGDGGGTDFGMRKCDHVYDSKAPYIASMDQLKLAQMTNLENAPVQKTAPMNKLNVSRNILPQAWKNGLIEFLVESKVPEEEAKKIIDNIEKAMSKNRMIYETLIIPFIEGIMTQSEEMESIEQQQQLMQNKEESTFKFNIIKEAMANPGTSLGLDFCVAPPSAPGDPCVSRKTNFRFARGHESSLSEKREITTILRKTSPVPTCGNGVFDAGEQCGEPTIGLGDCAAGLRCDLCQCIPLTCGNNRVDPAPEECDLVDGTVTGCAEGMICERTCYCVPPVVIRETVPGTVEEGTPGAATIVTKCSTFSSPAIETYFKGLNDRARTLLPGLMTSDLFCEAEGTMEASITVPGADKGVGAIIQRNGSLPEDFTEWTELKGTANVATKPTKLLPIDTAKGMKVVTPDLSASATGLSEAVVPLASDVVTSVNATENAFTLNNVLSWEMSTDTTKQVGVETIVNKVYNRVQPLMKSWSASGESDAFLKENAFAEYDMEQVLSQLAANASLCHDGFCELKAVKGLWPDYQTYSLMLVQGMKATRAGVTLPPVKVEMAYLGTPSAKAMGGGPSCKCDMTARAPDTLSIAALLMITAIATTGFVIVRVRMRKR